MTSAAALSVGDVSKSFGATRALQGVDLQLERGEVHALVGGNGSGKSTLIKILAGAQAPDTAGGFEIGGESRSWNGWDGTQSRAAGLRFVHQDLCLFPTLSVTENLAAGSALAGHLMGRISWRDANEASVSLLHRYGLNIDPRAPLETLGAADRAMVAILRALRDLEGAGSAGVLFLDEPTASLPRPEVQILLEAVRRLANAGHAVVYVSHRLDEIMAVTDRITVLRDGRRVTTASTADIDEDGLIELITGRRLASMARSEAQQRSRDPVLAVTEVSSSRLHDVTFEVHAGEVLGIAGLLGSGRSELLRVLFGDRPRTGGSVKLDGKPVTFRSPRDAQRQGVAYLPEDRVAHAAFVEMDVDNNLSAAVIDDYWSGGRLRHARCRQDSQSLLKRFSIQAQSVTQPLRTLSGGNQQKVVLARWLRRNPRLLLLDEPTQGVDVGARADIHGIIRAAVSNGAAAIIVTSDLQELAQIADRVLMLRDGTVAEVIHRPNVDVATVNEALYRAKERV